VVLATGESIEDIRNDPQYELVDRIITEKIPNSLDELLN
jgi:hypothetical protein